LDPVSVNSIILIPFEQSLWLAQVELTRPAVVG
jgi:hypothetical protein